MKEKRKKEYTAPSSLWPNVLVIFENIKNLGKPKSTNSGFLEKIGCKCRGKGLKHSISHYFYGYFSYRLTTTFSGVCRKVVK